jgi:hypothetical protein
MVVPRRGHHRRAALHLDAEGADVIRALTIGSLAGFALSAAVVSALACGAVIQGWRPW